MRRIRNHPHGVNALKTSPTPIQVSASARLHLGFLDPDATLGRRFGSIGLSLGQFSTTVVASAAADFAVSGSADPRVAELAHTILAHYCLPPTCRLEVTQTLPEHVGLGSGTQLALAVGSALTRLFGLAPSAAEIGAVLGRGKRSGIGLSLFERGGFIVDAGHGGHDAPPPVVAQVAFPSAWRVVLMFDRSAAGLSGRAELDAFRALPALPAARAAHLCHLTLMGVLPALVEHDFEAFARHIGAVQAVIGDHFARVQSGRYASAAVGAAIDCCAAVCGLSGLGQSSWGPTGFAFVPDAATGERVCTALTAHCTNWPELEFHVVAARNEGAAIKVLAPVSSHRQGKA